MSIFVDWISPRQTPFSTFILDFPQSQGEKLISYRQIRYEINFDPVCVQQYASLSPFLLQSARCRLYIDFYRLQHTWAETHVQDPSQNTIRNEAGNNKTLVFVDPSRPPLAHFLPWSWSLRIFILSFHFLTAKTGRRHQAVRLFQWRDRDNNKSISGTSWRQFFIE